MKIALVAFVLALFSVGSFANPSTTSAQHTGVKVASKAKKAKKGEKKEEMPAEQHKDAAAAAPAPAPASEAPATK